MIRCRLVVLLCLMLSGFACCRGGTLAQFRSVFGDIEVELYDQDKPITVRNFIRYIQSGRYENQFAHRLVPGFVVQGGGFTITNRGAAGAAILPVPTYPPITNEFGAGRRFSNTNGTLAMAKLGGDTNSATSQWFFNLGNNSFLDTADTNNLFVVFGHVVSGTNVLNTLRNFQYYTGTQTSNLVVHQYYYPPFDDLPLLRPPPDPVADTNLLFFDITLLRVAIQPAAGGGREISWDSVAGMTNIVEFTTNLPPAWNTLLSTNGNGNRMGLVDKAAAARRFYRVRIAH